ncbi:C45 family autoproteolytic acyltransferase/hydolase [Clostridium lundense]|uniref:C45 family autoproteolytic acyltransferase/hydolase n=1 Tax=Clostridium lundense TaxID=319475 RepID=UPI00047F6E39|nr:C45 family peptidase [Clostridium lundense]
MKEVTAYFKKFEGTSYEVGVQIGQWVLAHPTILNMALLPSNTYPQDKLLAITELLDKYCSGVNEEIKGFADTIGVSHEQVIFYSMTYLERGCSLMAALPSKTEINHTIMARNYDFNDTMEEMCFAKTKVKGKYSHIGSLLNLFGRCDGMNEHGLAACKASNGLPVGNFQGGQKPGVTGFQFWIVIRSILENCKNVEEAIHFAMEAPIGYNINLMLADKNNKIALLQCMDGHKFYEILDSNSNKNYLSVTNHVLFPELKTYEKMLIKNSELRNDVIVKTFEEKKKLSCDDIKGLLSTSYPQGLCCHYYEEFFGVLRSMIFDVTDGTIKMTFGSPQCNEWRVFTINSNEEQEYIVKLPYERADKSFYDITYLR